MVYVEPVAPEFNSSLQYLWRVSNLLWSAHMARMDQDTVKDEFYILEQLEIELDPRMDEEERWEASVLNFYAAKMNKRAIKEYFLYLNRIAHAKGLIMKDKSQMPAVVGNAR